MTDKTQPTDAVAQPATDRETHFYLAGWNGARKEVEANAHFRQALQAAPPAPAAVAADNRWCPDVCPITGRRFFMWVEHHDTGEDVPTYGGPFDSYTIPVKDEEGTYSCERYDHDAGEWMTEGLGWCDLGLMLVDDQSFVVAPENPRYDQIRDFAQRAALAAAPPLASDAESVLIDGIAYEVPAAVAGELLSLHLDLLAAASTQAVAVPSFANGVLHSTALHKLWEESEPTAQRGQPGALAWQLGVFAGKVAQAAAAQAQAVAVRAPKPIATIEVQDDGNLDYETSKAGWLLPAGLHKLYAAPAQAQIAPNAITIDFKQATELLAMFGGEPAEVTLIEGPGHNGEGLYAYYSDLPEEGTEFLGKPDNEALPAAPAQEHATQLAGQGQDLIGIAETWEQSADDAEACKSERSQPDYNEGLVAGMRQCAADLRAAAPAQAQEDEQA